jgi:hypothetical protein
MNSDCPHALQLQVTMQTLMNLCNCINASAHARTRHVPWRDSRLTRVLSDVFDGQHVIFLLAHTRYNAGQAQNAVFPKKLSPHPICRPC